MSAAPDFSDRAAEALELLHDIEAYLLEAAPLAGEGSQVSGIDLPALAVYLRCRALFDGAVLLIRNGHQENAFMQARSLFEESLWVQALSTEDRGPLARGWFVSCLQRTFNWLRVNAAAKGEPFTLEAACQQEVEQIREWMKGQGVTIERSLGSAKQLSQDFDRYESEFSVYAHGHMVVHGTLTLQMVMPAIKAGATELVARRPDDHFAIALVSYLVCSSILAAHLAVAELQGWEVDAPRLAALRARVDALNSGWPEST